jgi:hypothetical protein
VRPIAHRHLLRPRTLQAHALFEGYKAGIARGLLARHDHGSQYVSDYFQAELKFQGVTSSPAFVREPEGNGVAERTIRTLGEQLFWVRTFDTVEELRVALLEFKDRYDRGWLCGRHGHQTAQVRARLLERAELGRAGSPAARARAVEAPGSILRGGPLTRPLPESRSAGAPAGYHH